MRRACGRLWQARDCTPRCIACTYPGSGVGFDYNAAESTRAASFPLLSLLAIAEAPSSDNSESTVTMHRPITDRSRIRAIFKMAAPTHALGEFYRLAVVRHEMMGFLV